MLAEDVMDIRTGIQVVLLQKGRLKDTTLAGSLLHEPEMALFRDFSQSLDVRFAYMRQYRVMASRNK